MEAAGGTCGGFLADSMGLGKTLQMLMLIIKNPPPLGWAIKSHDEARGSFPAARLHLLTSGIATMMRMHGADMRTEKL